MKNPKTPRKKPYIDDGHTVYDMSGFSHGQKRTSNENHVGLTRKEKWAAISAAFACYLPPFLITLGGFFLVMWLLRLWLHV